jgi:4-hydroxy-3-polyprenylbenzoate decarboxylase
MAFASLREFLEKLDRLGQLRRIVEPVSLVHELTEIQRRMAEKFGSALFLD